MYYSMVDDGGFQFCDAEENKNVTESVSFMESRVLPDSNDRLELLEPIVFPKKNHDHGLEPYQLL